MTEFGGGSQPGTPQATAPQVQSAMKWHRGWNKMLNSFVAYLLIDLNSIAEHGFQKHGPGVLEHRTTAGGFGRPFQPPVTDIDRPAARRAILHLPEPL